MPYSQGTSNVYISNLTGTTLIYFDVDPTPFPVFEPQMFGAKKRTIPTRNSTTNALQSGTTIVFNTGSDLSSTDLVLTIPYLTAANYVKLLSLFETADQQVLYSPDNGTTVYQCAWAPGPLGLKKDPGWLNYTGTIKLIVLTQTVGTGGAGGPGGGG